MRSLVVVIVALVMSQAAHADDRALKPFSGQIVISPDVPPGSLEELPAFLKANATKDRHYELLAWDVHFAAVLARPAAQVTLVIADPASKKGAPLLSIELNSKRLVVLGHFVPTTTAGFEASKPYLVTLVANKTVVAKAELVLRY